MKIGVRVKIDVTKIDKDRLYQGQKGKYLDCTTFIDIDEQDQYNQNGFITQDVSKSDREAGIKGAILGNVQVFYKDGESQSQAPAQQQPQSGGLDDFEEDSIPFS